MSSSDETDYGPRLCDRCRKPVASDWDYAWCAECADSACHHGNEPAECNDCAIESDLAYDGAIGHRIGKTLPPHLLTIGLRNRTTITTRINDVSVLAKMASAIQNRSILRRQPATFSIPGDPAVIVRISDVSMISLETIYKVGDDE